MRALFPLLFATAALGTHNAAGSEPEHPAQRAPSAKRADAVGDPLPEQVLMRLGTLRGRNSGGFGAISPDGKYVVAGSRDGIDLWDLVTGKRIRKLGEISSGTSAAIFSPDGKDLLLAPRFPYLNFRKFF
jgi:hypothetical protein